MAKRIIADKFVVTGGAGLNVLIDDGTTIPIPSGGGAPTEAQIATINHAATAKTALVDADEVTGQDSATSFSLIRTVWSDVWTYIKSKADTFYLSISTDQTVSGIKTFLAGKIGIRNTANTFTSFFASAVTASRTWTFQDKSYTVADNADLAGKMAVPAGTANYLSKFLTATTIGVSRLWDTGSKLGIDTTTSPTLDITLGNQTDKSIGIEESLNTYDGRDLDVSAGRTVNYPPSAGFVRTFQTTLGNHRSIGAFNNGDMLFAINNVLYKLINGDGLLTSFSTISGITLTTLGIDPSDNTRIYAADRGASIQMKLSTNGGTTFAAISGETARTYYDIAVCPNSDTYATLTTSGDVYKRTSASGNFTAMGFTARVYTGIVAMPNGDVYVSTNGGDIYKITAGTSTLTALSQTNRAWEYGYTFGGDVYYLVGSSFYKQTSATGNFILVAAYTLPALTQIRPSVSLTTNNVFVANATDVYVQYNNGAGTADLNGGTFRVKAGTGKGTGSSDIEGWTGEKTTSGTDMQVLTKRYKIDNQGILTMYFTPVYADNAAALSGGLTAGMEYRTSTGVKMEVY